MSKNTNATVTSDFTDSIKMKVTIQKENETDNVVEVVSGITYVNELDPEDDGVKSIFNVSNQREFTFTKNMLKLFKNPPLSGTTNDEQFFYLGFDGSDSNAKLVLEGFGLLPNVTTNTGEIITSTNTFQTIADKLQFSDVSNNNLLTDNTAYNNNSNNSEYDEFSVFGESLGKIYNYDDMSGIDEQRLWFSWIQ